MMEDLTRQQADVKDLERVANARLDCIAPPQSYYAKLVYNHRIATVPTFDLESGITLHDATVAYSTWGTLNDSRDNVLVVCHALTGSSDALDWWRPLMGPGKALDFTRYFIFCANVLGSPYGSASPLATCPATDEAYGPNFPDTTVRDDVRIHKLVLDALGVQSIAAVVGGSMGGMHTLEWPLCNPSGYIKNIIPIATSAYQGAWGISWGETQRQAICADASFKDGRYEPIPEGQPRNGLGTARMIAMLTYRSSTSFEARFGRSVATPKKRRVITNGVPTPPPSDTESVPPDQMKSSDGGKSTTYSAQSYLHYQAKKFLDRFDANCYIHLTRKMDTHDISRARILRKVMYQAPSPEYLTSVLATVPIGALVIGVETDSLFPIQQQIELARCLPQAEFVALQSTDGHDGFLLEFERLNDIITQHLKKRCAWVYESPVNIVYVEDENIVASSVFGEIESYES